MKFKTRSVRTYLVIPVLILGIFSVIALFNVRIVIKKCEWNKAKYCTDKQIRNIICLDRINNKYN